MEVCGGLRSQITSGVLEYYIHIIALHCVDWSMCDMHLVFSKLDIGFSMSFLLLCLDCMSSIEI